jgi:hypothetical protein
MEDGMKALVLVCSFSICALAWADGNIRRLDVDPGYWQFTILSNLSGAPALPSSALARLTPEQRARFESAVKAMESSKPKPIVYNDCITEQELKQGNYAIEAGDDEWSCTSNSMTSQDGMNYGASETCTSSKTGETIKGSGSLKVDDREHFSGSGKIQSSTLMNDFQFSAKWLEASCPRGDSK